MTSNHIALTYSDSDLHSLIEEYIRYAVTLYQQ